MKKTGYTADVGKRVNALSATVRSGHGKQILGLSVRFDPRILPKWKLTEENFYQMAELVECYGLKGYPFVKSDINALEHGQIEVDLSTSSEKHAEVVFVVVSEWVNSLLLTNQDENPLRI
jgi:hypothetical protein